jgi:hypothetical protein
MFDPLIPAKAGIQSLKKFFLDSRLRGNERSQYWALVIARSESDEAIQNQRRATWIASPSRAMTR